jgi:hypothetical protein
MRVAVGIASVGNGTDVFVACGAGRVGVLNVRPGVGDDWVDMACTVNAAAVNTTLGSSVAGARDGRLQAASKNRMINKIERTRTLFIILNLLVSSRNCTLLYGSDTITDGRIFSFVPMVML